MRDKLAFFYEANGSRLGMVMFQDNRADFDPLVYLDAGGGVGGLRLFRHTTGGNYHPVNLAAVPRVRLGGVARPDPDDPFPSAFG